MTENIKTPKNAKELENLDGDAGGNMGDLLREKERQMYEGARILGSREKRPRKKKK